MLPQSRTLACVEQHVRVQASLEGEAPPTLATLERLLRLCPVDGLMRSELEDLGEGFPAGRAAQRLPIGSLRSSSGRPELESPFGGESWVTSSWVTSIPVSRLELTRSGKGYSSGQALPYGLAKKYQRPT